MWVQSKYSKESRKFEVADGEVYYSFWRPPDQGLLLPKEEYIPCDPPENWQVCTREMVDIDDGSIVENHAIFRVGNTHGFISGYRWAWSEKDPDALVMEKRINYE